MAFQAKLFINDQERNVLDSTFLYRQLIDHNGRPKTNIQDGKITLLIESTKNDELFYDWMFSTHTMYHGYVRFYKRDGFSKLFDFEFANCHCIYLEEKFNAEGNDPLKIQLTLSPGIQRVRGQIFEKNWNPSNPFIQAAPITEREENKSVTGYYLTDNQGNEIEDYETGQKIMLNIETSNRVGDKMNINLKDNEHDFKYLGRVLKGDTIKDYVISSDLEQIELEVIESEETA